jgi:acyl-CoA synthetase (AMP-forming)/AMP-acid ligase II
LQYTSGSTSAPKGVIITHGNLINETRCNARDLGLGADTRCVSWLPQYHDFGLISVIISSTVGNGHTFLLSPLTFLRRPHLWFEVMSRVRATHTAAPNFAYELAVRKTTPRQRAGWDLSSMRVFMSAAEPIRPSTMDKFYAAFAASGVAKDTFYPAYGLAEHTVSVSMGGTAVLTLDRRALERGEVRIARADGDRGSDGPGPVDGLGIFGCGRITKPGATARVIDPETRRPTPSGRIGEIWVNSNTKAAGYYGLDAETEAVFRATVAEDDDPTEYLRTGDLGFFHDGELFITGRVKDVIIVNGRNFHPEDLENSLRERTAAIRPGGLAAFSVPADDDEPERLIVFAESKEKKPGAVRCREIAEAIRHQLLADHRVAVRTVVVGRPGLVRKTTSGKVRRSACRQAYLADELGPTATAVDFPAG